MKNIIITILLVLGVSGAMAQEVYTSSGKTSYKKEKHTGYDPDRLIVGGGLNLGFSNGYTNIGASPIVGYRLTKNFSTGVGLGYQYYKYPSYLDPTSQQVYNSYMNIVYPNLWARYFVYRKLIFVNATFEYDFISLKEPLDNYGNLKQTKYSVTNQCLLMGVGFMQPLGGRVGFYGELYYDVLQGRYSPYPAGSPGLRFGIAAGF